MNNVEIIDYGIKTTMDKYPSNDELYYTKVIEQLIFNNYSKGITSSNNARSNIETLNKEDIICELLKNIVKKQAVKDSYGLTQALKTPEEYSERLNPLEKELWFYYEITNVPMEFISSIVDPNRISTNPDAEKSIKEKISFLTSNFVNSRFFDKDYGISKLEDSTILNQQHQDALEKIDNYYKKKNYNL